MRLTVTHSLPFSRLTLQPKARSAGHHPDTHLTVDEAQTKREALLNFVFNCSTRSHTHCSNAIQAAHPSSCLMGMFGRFFVVSLSLFGGGKCRVRRLARDRCSNAGHSPPNRDHCSRGAPCQATHTHTRATNQLGRTRIHSLHTLAHLTHFTTTRTPDDRRRRSEQITAGTLRCVLPEPGSAPVPLPAQRPRPPRRLATNTQQREERQGDTESRTSSSLPSDGWTEWHWQRMSVTVRPCCPR